MSDQKFPFDEEMNFRAWFVPLAMKLGINANPDDPQHFYDHRSFYRDMKAGKPGVVSPDKPGGHFPSTYKLPGHPRTFLADEFGRVFDTRSGQYINGENVPQRQLTASERSPDMPGFQPGLAQELVNSLKGFGGK